jgi:hypothetical protein
VQKHKTLATGLSLAFLLLFLASLAFRFWANDRAWKETGPTHITANAGQVFLFAAGDLYHLSYEGTLLAQYPGEVTGLRDDPIDLRMTGDNILLIAEQQPARIRSCEVPDWVCRDMNPALMDQLNRQFKVIRGPEHSLLVSDARGDMLWGIGKSGSEARKLVPDRLLAGPNDLAFDDDNSLWVADTDHRRLIELLPAPDGMLAPGREHSAVNHLTVGKRYYPTMLAPSQDGTWWVTQASEFSDGYADVVVYGPDEGAIARIELPGSIFATDIAAAGMDMLVTDFDRFTVYRVDSNTYQVSTFGEQKFTSMMTALRNQKERYLRISNLAMAGVIVFGILMVVAAVFATPRHKRWSQQPDQLDVAAAADAVPNVSGVHWLQRNPVLDRSIKVMESLSFVIFIIMIIGGLGLYALMVTQAGVDPDSEVQAKLDELGFLLLLCALMLAALVPIVRYSTRAMKRKLGTDGKNVYIQLNDGRELMVPPAELVYTNRAILYRQYSIAFHTGRRQGIYQKGEVETWLAPLLRQARHLSALQGFRHQWKHRDALLLWSLALGALLGLILILIKASGH